MVGLHRGTLIPLWNDLCGDPMLEMKNLRQEGSFEEYQMKFDVLLHQVSLTEHLLEKAAVSEFIVGLELHLQGPVRLPHVQTLNEAYAVAKLHNSVLTSQLPQPTD